MKLNKEDEREGKSGNKIKLTLEDERKWKSRKK